MTIQNRTKALGLGQLLLAVVVLAGLVMASEIISPGADADQVVGLGPIGAEVASLKPSQEATMPQMGGALKTRTLDDSQTIILVPGDDEYKSDFACPKGENCD